MIEVIKESINKFTNPQILFPILTVAYIFIFPITDGLDKINRRLGLHKLWTNAGGVLMMSTLFLFFAFGVTDPNFKKIIAKPDNVPIVGLLFLVTFFLWFSMKQAYDNDKRIADGKLPAEAEDAKEKVLVWPDLVYIEFIAIILCAGLLLAWALLLQAPIEEPANPSVSPNPSKAPWYFLGLQEMLVYFDPWLAGVLFPTVILVGFMAIPFIDNNPRGTGYFSFAQRRMAVGIFLYLWLILWIFLITTGTFLRGPNWNFFGPFEYWDSHKLEALTNVNLSEYIYMIVLQRQLPSNILVREMWGFLAVFIYIAGMPLVLSKTLLKKQFKLLGPLRYSVFVFLILMAASLPIKMLLRWGLNIKYIVAIPEFFFNI